MPAQSDSGPDKQQDMAQLQPGVAAAAAPQQKPFRVRTITAFLNLPADSIKWETEVEFAGRFLQYAQQQLESLGEQTACAGVHDAHVLPVLLCSGVRMLDWHQSKGMAKAAGYMCCCESPGFLL
jgi:hypothetical protein